MQIVRSYLYIIERIEVADETITSKNSDLTRFFIIKPRHAGRLKISSGWKNPGSLGHTRKNANYLT